MKRAERSIVRDMIASIQDHQAAEDEPEESVSE